MIRIELDNTTGKSRACYGDMCAPTIKTLCEQIAKGGADLSQAVEIYRDGALCFTYATLETWAGRGPKRDQPDQLKRK